MAKKDAARPKGIETFERFQKLAQLALSQEDGEPTEEARTAAVKAVEMLADDTSELVVLPRSEVESLKAKIDGAEKGLARVKEAKREGIIMGALGGLVLAKSGAFK